MIYGEQRNIDALSGKYEDDDEDSQCPAEESGHGHFFVRKTFHKPTYCHHCTDMLWGLIGQGFVCEVCSFVVHDRCLKTVVSPCASLAALSIANPVAHCWSEPGHFKRKFCNVCRKRLEDSDVVRCEICECYVHMECQEYVVSDCKECATYVPGTSKNQVVQYHQWHEGNLPGNSKCFLCRKTCWSSECLSGMRCEWCGVMAHAQCYKQLPQECSFGSLREIMLPPYCLTVPRMNVSTEVLYGIQRRQNQSLPASSTSDEPSSSGEMSRPDDEEKRSKEREGREKDSTRDEEVIRVYDGSGSAKRKSHCNVAIPKGSNVQVLLEASLRAFRLSGDPRDYFMSEITEPVVYTGVDEEERELDRNVPVRAQLSARDGKRLVAYLRYREEHGSNGYLRVYPGDLRHYGQLSNVPFRNVLVSKLMTTKQVLEKAIKKFGVNVNPDNFLLVEVLLDRGISEREMKVDEKPLLLLQQKRKESLRQSAATRFYVRQRDDPHGPNIAVYVGNLPTGWSQREYEKILLDIVGAENRWRKCDAIYYEQGALVLLYNDAVTAVRALNVLGQSSFDNKQLLVLLLPNVQPHMIPDGVTPLLVLVNVKSGGQQGQELIRSFRKLLNPHQVYDLMNGGPLPGLYVFRNIPYFKIIVCGGDGTVGWALSCLDNVGQDALCDSPPMAIVPLGTGNDLARVLRWGPGFTGTEEPLSILRDVIDAEALRLDRWTVIFHPNEKELDEVKVAIAHDTNTANTNEDTSTIFVMNNYFGIGIDANISLAFHNAREENPDKFNNRTMNKFVYFKLGLEHMVKSGCCKDLHKIIRLEVDDKPIPLPPLEGLIILNILSWAGGGNPWGPEREEPWLPPTHYDGMLEVVGVSGIMHLGQMQRGLRTGMRIAQGGHIRIQMLQDVPVQVDGEPWMQPPGTVNIRRSALKATMLKKSKSKFKRRNTEPSIYFPNEVVSQTQQSQQGPQSPEDSCEVHHD